MANWARANPNEFYRLYGRLLPVEMQGDISGALALTVLTGVPDKPKSDA